MSDSNDLINQVMCNKKQIKLITQSKDTEEEYEEQWGEMENGSHYTGTVKNRMPNGLGKEYRSNYLYTGYFLEGKWHGKGLITTNVFEDKNGEFIDGYFCGI